MVVEGTGVFSMNVVNKILEIECIATAKQLALDTIKSCPTNIRKDNIKKAKKMIEKAKSQRDLAFGMSNFILAFQGEKVIK